MRCRVLSALFLVLVVVGVGDVGAQTFGANAPSAASPFSKLTFTPASPPAALHLGTTEMIEFTPPQRQLAFEYSDGYRTRAKIHRIASIATLPLFALEGIVGQSLYNNPTDSKKSAHLAIATGLGALFAVNSVTGVWNLLEARKDPNHNKRRTIHGILMLAADAGFLATAMTGPENEAGEGSSGNRGQHRAIAFTSIGLATVSYLIMLIGG